MQRNYVRYRSTVLATMIMVIINDSVHGGHDRFLFNVVVACFITGSLSCNHPLDGPDTRCAVATFFECLLPLGAQMVVPACVKSRSVMYFILIH